MAILRASGRQARLREWRAQLRLRTRLERNLTRRLNGEFRATGRAAVAGYRADGRVGAGMAMAGHRPRLTALLAIHHRRVFQVFGERLAVQAKAAFQVLETKDSENFFNAAVIRWLELIVGERVTRIDGTTRRLIMDAILEGEQAGEGIEAIGKRIREKTSGTIGRARSLLIARTETHAASTAADDEMVRALGLDEQLLREWVSAEDERTRQAHRAPTDGQIRKMDEPFDVDGVKMDRPGDPSAPPRLVINCRCVLAYRGTDLD